MTRKFILLLTDEEIILHQESFKKIYNLEEGIESIQAKLKNHFLRAPTTSFVLLIDRNQQDIKEETLPSLLLWDRFRLLSHKRAEWAKQGEFHGNHVFKQDGKSFLQWVNISLNDPVSSWCFWIKNLPNPSEGIRFVSLEAGQFLKKYGSGADHYQLMIYMLSQKVRYVIFKNKRLLLSRFFLNEEDLRTSLHFLSRYCPDIYEKLQILSLVPDISLTFPRILILPDPQVFFNFLGQQKKGTLSLTTNTYAASKVLRKWVEILFLSSLSGAGFFVYQIWHDHQEAEVLFSKIDQLKIQIKHKQHLINNKNVTRLRSALDHYRQLQTQIRLPVQTLEVLAIVLDKHKVSLESFAWSNEKSLDIEISFLLPNPHENSLINQFKRLLSSLSEAFPQAQIQVLEAPFQSGVHQTYEYPLEELLPMGHIRIIGL